MLACHQLCQPHIKNTFPLLDTSAQKTLRKSQREGRKGERMGGNERKIRGRSRWLERLEVHFLMRTYKYNRVRTGTLTCPLNPSLMTSTFSANKRVSNLEYILNLPFALVLFYEAQLMYNMGLILWLRHYFNVTFHFNVSQITMHNK